MKWINAALAFDENGAGLLLKAKILAELKRFDEAIETGGKALNFYKAKNLVKPADDTQKLIDEWKKMK